MTEIETPQELAIWERHNLAAANILGIKDRIDYLTDSDGRRLRSVVLRELGEFAEFACALLRASADGVIINEVYIEHLLEDVRRS